MSNGNAALALALGAGAGLGLHYLLRDDEAPKGDAGPSAQTATAPTASSATAATPCALRLDAQGLTADGAPIDIPAAVAKCQAAGRADLVLADDAPSTVYADLAAAFHAAGILISQRRNARARRRPRRAARRDARPPRYLASCGTCYSGARLETNNRRAANAHATSHLRLHPGHEVHVTDRKVRTRDDRDAPTYERFTLRIYPNGTKAGAQLRHFHAEPATSWKDAYYRLIAAGIVEARRAGRTQEAGGWMLSVDPAQHQPDRSEALP